MRSKTKQEIKMDMAALNLVFEKDEMKHNNEQPRFYIDIMKVDEQECVVVWDGKLNRLAHKFGTIEYYSKLMTEYAELPSTFTEMSA